MDRIVLPDGKPLIHSHSSLEMYNNCPFQFNGLKIAKVVQDVYRKGADWGTQVHDALDKFMKDGTPLPAKMSKYAQLAQYVREIPGDMYCEHNLSMRHDGSPCGFFDKDGWLRGKIDVLFVDGQRAMVIDWKTTGNAKFGKNMKGQPARNALKVFANFPDVQEVNTRFLCVVINHIDRETFTRGMIPEMRADTERLDSEIRWSLQHNSWPTRPSGLCGYCAIGLAGKCPDYMKARRR